MPPITRRKFLKLVRGGGRGCGVLAWVIGLALLYGVLKLLLR